MKPNPMIVAEISASHDGSFTKALQLIDAAKDAGATAVKFQTFEPELLVGDHKYIIDEGPWQGTNLLALYKAAHTPKKWHKSLFDYAHSKGLIAFSTPFHESDVDFLETLDCPMYKISSFDIINIPLIERAARTGKPLILSTGMANRDEVEDAYTAVITSSTAQQIPTILHCVSDYPTPLDQVNLQTMTDLQAIYGKSGISDHTRSTLVPALATALGAEIIEKHIALDEKGLDGKFALLPHQFAQMVQGINQVIEIMGRSTYNQKTGETASLKLRPSLYYAEDLKAGCVLEPHHLIVARPALGAAPFYRHQLIGRELTKNVKKGEPCIPSQ